TSSPSSTRKRSINRARNRTPLAVGFAHATQHDAVAFGVLVNICLVEQAMKPDADNPPMNPGPPAVSLPPPLPESGPPVLGDPPPLAAASPPPLPADPACKARPERQLVALLLSLCLGLFLADAVVSLADNLLILLFNLRVLSAIQGLLFFFALLMGIAIYGL